MMRIRVNVVCVIGDEGWIVNNTTIMGERIGFRLETMTSSRKEEETTTSSHSMDDIVALVQYFYVSVQRHHTTKPAPFCLPHIVVTKLEH
jgi:hypothetical protein